MTDSHRVLHMPERFLRRPGGFNRLEQELTRCSNGGFVLVRGCSAVDPATSWWRGRQLRFLFASVADRPIQDTEYRAAPGSDGCEYTVVVVTLVGKPAGDPTLYAHNASDQINELSRYGYRVVECQAWSRYWLVILERPFGGKVSGVRYEVVPVDRNEAASIEDDRYIVGMVSTRRHVFLIRVVPKSRRRTGRIRERDRQRPATASTTPTTASTSTPDSEPADGEPAPSSSPAGSSSSSGTGNSPVAADASTS